MVTADARMLDLDHVGYHGPSSGFNPPKVTPPNDSWFIVANEPLLALVCHE